MTHQNERSAMRSLVELAIEHGTEAMAAAFNTLMNRDTLIEREQVLKAESRSGPIVKGTQTDSSPRRRTPASGSSNCGSHRPAATATRTVGRSIPRLSTGAFVVRGR